MQMTKCPVCGAEIPEKNLVFHLRKKSVFEVYQAYKEKKLIDETSAPHEFYIQANQVYEPKFKIIKI